MPSLPPRIRLVVLYGGRSAEHEVSCISARHVLAAADPARYELVAVGIDHEGRWIEAPEALEAVGRGDAALPSPDKLSGAVNPLHSLGPGEPGTLREQGDEPPVVVFPLLHGPMGEDGTVQGLLEVAGVPYVGAGVLASSVCMDKAMAKLALASAGLPLARWLAARDVEIDGAWLDHAVATLGLPLFVKPANMGSSVGVTKAADRHELAAAITEALRFDEYVVVEEAVNPAREIEVAVLGNAHPIASVPGEIGASQEFYTFDDKYLAGTSSEHIPAPLPDDVTEDVRRLALEAYRALKVDGLARVDFFYEEGKRGLLLNELNTIPGFTPISMYPKLWAASGLPYARLIDELVALAIERRARRDRFDAHR